MRALKSLFLMERNANYLCVANYPAQVFELRLANWWSYQFCTTQNFTLLYHNYSNCSQKPHQRTMRMLKLCNLCCKIKMNCGESKPLTTNPSNFLLKLQVEWVRNRHNFFCKTFDNKI